MSFTRPDNLSLIKPYGDFLKLFNSIHTISNYQQDLRVFKFFLDRENIKTPLEVNSHQLTEFISFLNQSGSTPSGKLRMKYSTRSIKRILASLRSFYRYLAATQQISQDPTAVFHYLAMNSPQKNPRPLSLTDRTSLLSSLRTETIDELNITLTVLLGYECGLRVSEISKLRIQNINLSQNYILVTGKGNKERILPITSGLKSLLYRALENSRASQSIFLFPSPRSREKPIHPHFLELNVKQAANWAKLENSKELTVHVLRHTFGSILAESGASAYEIRDLMGHSSISVSENYVKIAQQSKLNAYEKAFGSGFQAKVVNLNLDKKSTITEVLELYRNHNLKH
jgi:site-specific recombinase XerD